MILYVTLAELKTYKGIPAEEVGDDARLFRAVRNATSAWDRWTWRSFEPIKKTRAYDHPGGQVLRLRGDLLEALEVQTQNGAVTLVSADYYLSCGDRYDLTPYDRLTLRTDRGVCFSFAGTTQQANTVTGIWGYHPAYDLAWVTTGDTVQNSAGLDASTESLLVNDADAPDFWGFAARFQTGQLLRVEDEYLYLWSTAGAGANTLRVRRGINGTTAATHDKGTEIYTWRVHADVWEQVLELAAYLYDLKDSQVYDVTATPETGLMVIPKGIPASVRLAVQAYRRHEI